MLEIDGSYGEGGGQIVRTALVLSLFTGIPIRIFNIRRGRKKPGLKTQHLFVLRTLRKMTTCQIQGDRLGNWEIRFVPGVIQGGSFSVDFQTAGSIPLFLQTLLPVSLFADHPVHLVVRGGTDVPMSMTWDYFEHVLIPYYRPLARDLQLRCTKRGYYPPGGGEIELNIVPRFRRSDFPDYPAFQEAIRSFLGPLMLDRKEHPETLEVWFTVSEHLKNRKVRERMIQGFQKAWTREREILHVKGGYTLSPSPGCSGTAVVKGAHHIAGVDLLCRKGTPAERLGTELARELGILLQGPDVVDLHLQDNLVLLLALRGGRLKTSHLTAHTQTHVWLVEQFLGKRFRYENALLMAV